MKLSNCPRCSENHEIELKDFESPVVEPDPFDPKNPCIYHKWAICPTKQEPILFKDRDLDDIMIPIPPRKEDIEKLAYKLWEYEGYPHGMHEQHWLTCETVLTSYFRVPSAQRIKNTYSEESKNVLSDYIVQKNKKAIKIMENNIFRDYFKKVLSFAGIK